MLKFVHIQSWQEAPMTPSPRVRLYVALLLLSSPCLFPARSSAQGSQDKPKIGFLLDSLKVERWQTDFDSFKKRAEELGASVELGDADGNDDLQFKQAKKMLDQHVKALVYIVDIKIVADIWCPDWKPLEAYTRITDVIEKNHGQITEIVASNDGTAGGAVQALEENKLDGKVAVSGQDADLAAIIRILKDTQTMTVYKPLASLASQA